MLMGWVDYSRQERETIKELLKLLGESASLDELGVGIVRDSISDLLYPGTSVLHTRAKYYILIPELFKKAMKSGLTTGSEVRNLINSDQDKIARLLRRVTDKETGIIGGRSDRAVKMKPTRIYWNALRTTEILCMPSMSFDDACIAVAAYNRKRQNVEIKTETEDGGGDDADAGNGGFSIFSAPCKQSIEDYFENPTLHLTRDEACYLREQFIHIPVMKDTLMEYCLKTKQSYLDTDFLEMKAREDMPDVLARHIELAKEFSGFIFGAYTVYNLLLFENGGAEATEEQLQTLKRRYSGWKKNCSGIPHREEILRLVKGHDTYLADLDGFLSRFEAAVKANHSEECSEEEKAIIRNREAFWKKGKAKIGKNFPYQEIQSVPLSFRHGTAQRIITDILEGMTD